MSSPKTPFLADLEARDLLRQLTAETGEPDFSTKPTLYVGYDPSAASLHAGSLLPLTAMDRFRRRGGQIIVLIGGATGMIGDPSGKDQERTLETEETIIERGKALARQVGAFFERTDGPAPMFLNNADFYRKMSVIDFLRDVGKNFSVNQMLQRESVKGRIENREQGISYTEFSYQVLQAYDFLHMFRHNGCTWQMGATDQWGNIVSGVDLIRRAEGKPAHGLTLPLLTNSAGKKYGKSEKGAVWLDPELTSPYEFYQFWLNSADDDVGRFLLWLTDFTADEIAAFTAEDPAQRRPQRELAHWLTTRVHGKGAADVAQSASEVLFYGRFDALNDEVARALSATVPSMEPDGTNTVIDVLVTMGAAKSNSEARRLISQNAVSANGVPCSDPFEKIADRMENLPALIVSVGKNRKYLMRRA